MKRIVVAIMMSILILIAGPAQANTLSESWAGSSTEATTVPTEKSTAWINGVQFTPDSGSSLNGSASPMATWAACGAFDSEEKLVRQYWRSGWAGVVTSGQGYLRCGSSGNNWGYRHIQDAHQQDWENIAVGLGSDWRSFADWCIENILANPDYVVYRDANATFTFRSTVYIYNNQGQLIATYRPVVSIGLGNERVITAFPAH